MPEIPAPLAIITGGTSGIGLAAAVRLSDRYRLALIYSRDAARAQAVQNQFGNTQWVKCFAIDLASDESVAMGYPEIFSHFGVQPCVLVHCVGISVYEIVGQSKFFMNGLSLDVCAQVMNLNYFGALRMIQKVLPGMYSRRQGSIVSLSSVAAQGGYAGSIGYAESKAALECFTRDLAVEVGHRNISVNCVAPGLVATAATQKLSKQQNKVNLPLGRWIRAEEVAEVIDFLIGMGPVISGQTLTIDGARSVGRLQHRSIPEGGGERS